MPGIQLFDTKDYQWSDQSVAISGATVTKIHGVGWSIKQEMSYTRGQGDDPQGIQTGNREYPFTLRIKKNQVDDMNRAALAAGGRDWLDVEFDVTINYRATAGRALQTHIFAQCRAGEVRNEWDQGAQEMICVVDCLALGLKSS